jgi:lactoylglutathione lyase
MAHSPRVISTAEREAARKLRAVLARCNPGDSLPEGDDFQRFLSQLERLIPEVLSEGHREWQYEGLDGFYLKTSQATAAEEAEFFGFAILITDQTVAPFHVRVQISPAEDRIDWMECRIGVRKANGLERTPGERLSQAFSRLSSIESVDWMYRVGFGEHRPALRPAQLSLVVLKTRQVEQVVEFYRQLGIEFDAEQHGKGPVHFAARLGELVLEVYPLDAKQAVDTTTRLGFSVSNVAELVTRLETAGIAVVSPVKESAWGRRAVVRDPDGRAIELLEHPA